MYPQTRASHRLNKGDFLNILILAGGDSPEREVSLVSGRCVLSALAKRHRADFFDTQNGLPDRGALAGADVVFLALHGGKGEDGTVQRHLEELGIFHYTGSDPAASALAMQKDRAKAAVSAAGVPVAAGGILPPGVIPAFCGPMIFKPICGGSSVGLVRAETPAELPRAPFPEPMLWERLLPGREYSVSLLADTALPVVEICPLGGVYDYAHKYTAGATSELCPAPIPAQKTAYLQRMALLAARTLHLRDYARVDFKEDEKGVPCFLEANTLPGMTGESLMPLAARTAGISFEELCERMATFAALRKK